jgi:hypothetical protein
MIRHKRAVSSSELFIGIGVLVECLTRRLATAYQPLSGRGRRIADGCDIVCANLGEASGGIWGRSASWGCRVSIPGSSSRTLPN